MDDFWSTRLHTHHHTMFPHRVVSALVLIAVAVLHAAAAAPFADAASDSSLGSPIFSTPGAIREAERTLSPQIDRVPLQDAINAMPLEGTDRRQISPEAMATQSNWQRRAFASFAVVALACVAVAALAALLSIGRRP